METFWQSKSVDIGYVRRNTSRNITFQALPTIPKISQIVPGCGCTKVKYDPSSRLLSVVYNAGEIPKQIQGNQTILKYVNIFYEQGGMDVLQISGVKIR